MQKQRRVNTLLLLLCLLWPVSSFAVDTAWGDVPDTDMVLWLDAEDDISFEKSQGKINYWYDRAHSPNILFEQSRNANAPTRERYTNPANELLHVVNFKYNKNNPDFLTSFGTVEQRSLCRDSGCTVFVVAQPNSANKLAPDEFVFNAPYVGSPMSITVDNAGMIRDQMGLYVRQFTSVDVNESRTLSVGAQDIYGNNAFNGDIAEVIIYKGVLNASDDTYKAVSNYLRAKWFGESITPTPPTCPIGMEFLPGVTLEQYRTPFNWFIDTQQEFIQAIADYGKDDYQLSSQVVDEIDRNVFWDFNLPYISLFRGYLRVDERADYQFRLAGNYAVEWYFDEQYLAHCNGVLGLNCSTVTSGKTLQPGYYPIEFNHSDMLLSAFWQLGWKKESDFFYSVVPKENLFSCQPSQSPERDLRITGSSHALTCKAQQVTLSVLDSNQQPDTAFTGRVNLSTNQSVTWSVVQGSSSALTQVQGQWGYNFSGEGSVVLSLRYQNAGDVTITASASNMKPENFGPIAFRPSGFIASTNESHPIAGKPLNVTLKAVTAADDGSGNLICDTITDYNESGIEGWYQHQIPAQPVGSPVLTSDAGQFGVGEPQAQSINLSFNAGAATLTNVEYNDAGKIALAFKDDSVGLPGGTGSELVGGLDLLFSPLALVLTNEQAAGSNNVGGFAAAGEAFSFDIRAVAWEKNGDTDLTNNAITPSFSADVSLSTAVDESRFHNGVLSTTRIPASAFTDGVAALDEVTSYSEVGPMKIEMKANWIEADNAIEGNSKELGRFYPARFVVLNNDTLPKVHNGNSTHAGCADFTYMDDRAIDMAFTLQAVNASGQITLNYDPELERVYSNYQLGQVTVEAENNRDGVARGSRLCQPKDSGCETPAFPQQWQDGQWRFAPSKPEVVFAKLTTPDGPLNTLQLGVKVVADPDGSAIDSPDMLGATVKSIGDLLDLRYGRLRAEHVYGAENIALTLPIKAQYYDSSRGQFVVASDDKCTKLDKGLLTLAAESAGDLSGIQLLNSANNATTDVQNFQSLIDVGLWHLDFTAPNAMGRVPVQLNLKNYPDAGSLHFLKFDWDSDHSTPADVPSVDALWGQYRGNDRVIYWREQH